jgi:hypothetical protein
MLIIFGKNKKRWQTLIMPGRPAFAGMTRVLFRVTVMFYTYSHFTSLLSPCKESSRLLVFGGKDAFGAASLEEFNPVQKLSFLMKASFSGRWQ